MLGGIGVSEGPPRLDMLGLVGGKVWGGKVVPLG